MFPAWKNAGPSTVDKPTIEKETRSKEDLDLPWQVVVHNDPVNLMSYVTMVFQRVFGYPREKAERHKLEVVSDLDARAFDMRGARIFGDLLHQAVILATAIRWFGT